MRGRNNVFSVPFHPAGVDVWGSHGRYPLLQGGPYLQEVRPLQGSGWSQPGPGKVVTSLDREGDGRISTEETS